MKKLLLTLLGVLTMLPAFGFEYTYEGTTLEYTILDSDAKTVEVSKNPLYRVSGDIVLPATVTYSNITYTVTSIGDYAFHACSDLTSIELPPQVTSIGWCAFDSCSSLSSIVLPDSLTSIGNAAFRDCAGLTSIDLPDSLTSIGGGAFERCGGLTSIDLPDSLTSIDGGAFSGCSGLTSVKLAASLTSIGDGAFYDCTGITSVEFPASLTSIGRRAFCGCTGLTSVELPASLTSIGNEVFLNCSSLTSVELPASLTSIGSEAFCGCSVLTSIELPASLTSIGDSAFCGCAGLTAVELPASLTSIGGSVFFGCKSLTSLELPTSLTSIGRSAFSGCAGLTVVEFPASLTAIGSQAFYGCSSLTSIDLPATLTSIGSQAFYGCSSLTSIELPASLISFNGNIVDNCTSLVSLTIPPIVDGIGSMGWRISGCDKLKRVVCPAQYGLKPELHGTCSPTHIWYDPEDVIYENGFVFNADQSHIIAVPYNKLPDGYRIPETVTSIGTLAFLGCTNLTSVEIPNSVKSIGSRAFEGCPVKTVVLPASIEVLGNGIFTDPDYVISDIRSFTKDTSWSGNSPVISGSGIRKAVTWKGGNLPDLFPTNQKEFNTYPATDVVIEKGIVYSSDKSVIYQVIPLHTDYTLPSEVAEIADGAFSCCEKIMSIYTDAVPSPKFNASAFEGHYDITSVTVPLEVYGEYVYPGSDWLRFANLKPVDTNAGAVTLETGDLKYRYISDNEVAVIASDAYKTLSSVSVPSSLTILVRDASEDGETVYKDVIVSGIAEFAFADCPELASVTLPESITKIGTGAFRDCTSLASIRIPQGVTRIAGSTFAGCSGLSEVIGSDHLMEIGNGAFSGTALSAISLPNVTIIGRFAFDGVAPLISINFGTGLTEIGDYAFRGTAIPSLELTSADTLTIGEGAFMANDVLKSVILGDGVTEVGDYAFADCKKLTSLTASADLQSIGKRAFNCTNAGLTTLNLEKEGALTAIGDSAFNGIRVRELNLPDALTSIGDDAFGSARLISKIVLPANKDLKIGRRAFAHCQRLAELNFPETISAIGDSCFVDNIIPTLDVKADNIGERAFVDSKKLTLLSVTGKGAIGEYAFSELPELESATLDIPVIGTRALSGAAKLSEVNFTTALEALNDYALYDTAVDSLSFPSGPEIDPVIVVGRNIISGRLKHLALGNRTKALNGSGFTLRTSDIPFIDLGISVQTITDNGLDVQVAGSRLAIPASLQSLGLCTLSADSVIVERSPAPLVFTGSSYTYPLTGTAYIYVDRPLERKSTPRRIFSTKKLEFGDNPDANITLMKDMLYSSLSELIVGAAVKSIESFTAAKVTFGEGIESIKALTITGNDAPLHLPASLKTLGTITNAPKEVILSDSDTPLEITGDGFSSQANLVSFYGGRDIVSSTFSMAEAPKLENVILGDKATTVNDRFFQNCTALKSVIMGDNVATVGDYAFAGCTNLDILSIGENTRHIGTNAYEGCTGFSRIVARGLTPPSGMAGFGMEVEDNVPLYVPEAALDDYMASDLFFAFANIESQNDNIVEEVEIEGEIDPGFTVGSQIRIPDWLKFIFHLVGHITGHHAPAKAPARKAASAETPDLYWFAPNPAVASVDQEGVVTVNAPGDFEIWAYVMDGSDKRIVISTASTLTGDLNDDGVLNSTDISLLAKRITENDSSELTIRVGDLNGDGVVNVTDLQMLVNKIK